MINSDHSFPVEVMVASSFSTTFSICAAPLIVLDGDWGELMPTYPAAIDVIAAVNRGNATPNRIPD